MFSNLLLPVVSGKKKKEKSLAVNRVVRSPSADFGDTVTGLSLSVGAIFKGMVPTDSSVRYILYQWWLKWGGELLLGARHNS